MAEYWYKILGDIIDNPNTDSGRKLVPILWGLPGVGKTARVEQLAKEKGAHLETVILSIRDASDVAGLPYRTENGVEIAPPDWAVRAHQAAKMGKKAIVFFDELTTVPRTIQAAALRILAEGYVGSLYLGDNVTFIAAANPPEVAAGGFDLEPPMANRLIHLHVEPNLEEWVQWATRMGNSYAMVAAFLKTRPDLLIQFPKERKRRTEAWPSPRSWEVVANAIGRYGNEPGVLDQLVIGAVGNAAGVEFLNWLKEADLPMPEKVLSDPLRIKLPERADQLYAVALSTSSFVLRATNSSGENRTSSSKKRIEELRNGLKWFQALMELLTRIYKEGNPGVAIAGGSVVVNLALDYVANNVVTDIPKFYQELSSELLETFNSVRQS